MQRHAATFALKLYIVLCVTALLYIAWLAVSDNTSMELAGIFVLILGLPWSLGFTALLAFAGISSAWAFAAAFIVSLLINGWLLKRYASGARPPSRSTE